MHPYVRRLLGILSLGGSFIGFTAALSMLAASPSILEGGIRLVFVLLYALGIWAGLRLIESAAEGIKLSLIFWWTQVPYFMSPAIGYAFFSGANLTPYLRLGDDSTGSGISWRIGSEFRYAFMSPGEPWLIGINLVAVAAIYVLWRGRRAEATAHD